MAEYMTDADLALQVDYALQNEDRTQQEVADELDVDQSAVAHAKTVDEDHPARLRRLRIRILRHLLGATVEGPFFRVSFNGDD